jgi:hypothetical protein
MLIMVVTSSRRANIQTIFITPKEISFFLDSTVECELCVYGQETGESERITRICFAHN